jgi:hypothetical protein
MPQYCQKKEKKTKTKTKKLHQHKRSLLSYMLLKTHTFKSRFICFKDRVLLPET